MRHVRGVGQNPVRHTGGVVQTPVRHTVRAGQIPARHAAGSVEYVDNDKVQCKKTAVLKVGCVCIANQSTAPDQPSHDIAGEGVVFRRVGGTPTYSSIDVGTSNECWKT